MNTIQKSVLALGLTVCLASPLVTPMAMASEEGHRNTAIALGAASAALLLTQKDKTAGIIAGVGALYAESQHERSIRQRHDREGDWSGDYRNDRRGRVSDADYRRDRDESYYRERARQERLRREREERAERERRERMRREELRRERIREEARRDRRNDRHEDRYDSRHDYRGDRH